MFLLDDPLSAVDMHVGKQLFDECVFFMVISQFGFHQVSYLFLSHVTYAGGPLGTRVPMDLRIGFWG